MPVILPLSSEKNWLEPDFKFPYFIPELPAELLTSYPVTPKMNRATFNEPAAIAPLEPAIS
jgi:hypothetical protein